MRKRRIAIFLALTMVLALFPAAAMAAETDAPEGEELHAYLDINNQGYDVDGENHVFRSGTDGEEARLPQGVSYDVTTNTMTLENASLSQLRVSYSGVDEETGETWKNMPTDTLTIVLKGDSAISLDKVTENMDPNAIALYEGASLLIKGDGSLTVTRKNAKSDAESGAAIVLYNGGGSLTIAEKAHVTAATTGENKYADEWGTNNIAIGGDYEAVAGLTVKDQAALEAYSDCAAIDALDVTVQDSAALKTSGVSLGRNMDIACLAAPVFTVKDSAQVDVSNEYIPGGGMIAQQPLSLNDGSVLKVEGGKLSVNLKTTAVGWGDGAPADTALGAWFDDSREELLRCSILVGGGELNVTSQDCAVQLQNADFVQTGGKVNVTGKYWGTACFFDSAVTLKGGSFNTVVTAAKADMEAEDYGVCIAFATSSLTVSGGTHTFGSRAMMEHPNSAGLAADMLTVTGGEITAYGNEAISSSLDVTGGSITAYGKSAGVSQYAVAIGEDEDLPTMESTLDSFHLGQGVTATDLESGKALNVIGFSWDEDLGNGEKVPAYYVAMSAEAAGTELAEDLSNAAKSVRIGAASKFSDVPQNAYYYDPVQWAVGQNITTGATATTFDPAGPCTRAQAVTFLWRAAGAPEPAGTGAKFTDVPEGQYYTKAVQWAVEQGITTGATAATFDPNGKCSRAQIVTFLWRYEGRPTVASSGGFTDVGDSAYYAAAVNWAVSYGITTGATDTTFAPTRNCSRAEIVTFLYRACVPHSCIS